MLIVLPFRNKTNAATPINTTIQQYSFSFWVFDVLKLSFDCHLKFSAMGLRVFYHVSFKRLQGRRKTLLQDPAAQ